MKIADSKVSLGSLERRRASHTLQEQMRTWTRGSGTENVKRNRTSAADSVQLSGTSRRRAAAAARLQQRGATLQSSPRPTEVGSGTRCERDAPEELLAADESTRFMAAIFARMFGIEVSAVRIPTEADVAVDVPDSSAAPAPSPDTGPDWAIELSVREERVLEESAHFQASGKVTTADGRTIDFSTELTIEHRQVRTSEVVLRAGNVQQLVDPLVLNFGGGTAAFGSDTMQFDIDADGSQETIAELTGSSAYLALDRDGDDTVNDGSELFGPTSGDGFAELAQHDDNDDGWIDESDVIFERLRLWSPQRDDGLRTLADAGVGAIYLDNASTRVTLDAGQLQKTGVFLEESGVVGTVQHVDLADLSAPKADTDDR